ncbi:unnamed protein product, partial [Polarella glacialis]
VPDATSDLSCTSQVAEVGGPPVRCQLRLRREGKALRLRPGLMRVESTSGSLSAPASASALAAAALSAYPHPPLEFQPRALLGSAASSSQLDFDYSATSFSPSARLRVSVLGREHALLHRGRLRDALGTLTKGLKRTRAAAQAAEVSNQEVSNSELQMPPSLTSPRTPSSSSRVALRRAESSATSAAVLEAEALRARLLVLTGRWEAARAFHTKAAAEIGASKLQIWTGEAKGRSLSAPAGFGILGRRTFLAQLAQDIELGESAMVRGLALLAAGSFRMAVVEFSTSLEVAMESEQLRLLRAECSLKARDYGAVRVDVGAVLGRINPLSTGALWLLGLALVRIVGQIDAGLHNLELCLRWAFGHKPCSLAVRSARAVRRHWEGLSNAQVARDWLGVTTFAEQLLEADPEADYFTLRARRALCHAHRELGESSKAINSCQNAT